MDKKVLQKEREHLNETLEILKNYKEEMEKSLKTLGEQTIERLEELRGSKETSQMDFFLYLEQIHQKHAAFNIKDRYKRIEEMEYSLDEPYFARIDLQKKESDTPKKFYIGKFGFTPKDEPLITDWRSKVASVYYRYRYPQKNVKYETPEGTKTRDLILKRTFDIDGGELNKYYNNDIQLDESEIIAEKIETRTGGVLEDIVETIQASQLDIIEEDPRSFSIVQGCVGSGKSTVAIHKLSHIFFNYPKVISPKRSILIAKKQILVSYLSTLFPKLGIFDINYKTLSDLVYNFVFREELKITVDFSLPKRKDLLGLDKYKKLNELVSKAAYEYEERLDNVFTGELEPFGGYAYDYELTPYENLQYVTKELSEEFKAQKDLLKDNPKSDRAWLYKLNISSLRKILNKLNKIKRDLRIKTFGEIIESFEINTNSTLDYASTILYVYAYSQLIGFKNFRKYQYCVVDEGQDFSPMEFAVMGSFILYNRLSVLGDLNQGYMESGLKNWDQLKEIFGKDNINLFELTTNYRSTKPIIDLANEILEPFTQKYLPKSINRKGEDPIFKSFKNKEELYKEVKKDLKKDSTALKKSVGVICYDNSSFSRMKEIVEKLPIENEKRVILDSDKKIDFKPHATYLTKFENCKGLEFAKVYIIERDPRENENISEAKRSFIGVTRAMDEVASYYIKK